MKKQIIYVIVSCICIFLLSSVAHALNDELPKVTLFINDEKIDLSVYNNFTVYQGYYLEAFVPFVDILNIIGYDVYENTNERISGHDEKEHRYVTAEFFDNYFRGNHYATSMYDYITISDIHYVGIYTLAKLIYGYAVQRGDNIYLYTYSYYTTNVAISASIGHLVGVSVYVNNILIEAPIYYDLLNNRYLFPHDVFNYVKLDPILNVLETNLKNEIQAEISNGDIEEIIYIDGEIYIKFYKIRNLMNGNYKQDDYLNIYLYSSDFIRTDIPATLKECYAALDELLDDEMKEVLKSGENFALHHMGLGMWIRNNWIYPTDKRIAKFFNDNDIYHPDDMSSIILSGYKNYLNGLPYELYSPETRDSLFGFIKIIVFIFVLIFAMFIWRKRNIIH